MYSHLASSTCTGNFCCFARDLATIRAVTPGFEIESDTNNCSTSVFAWLLGKLMPAMSVESFPSSSSLEKLNPSSSKSNGTMVFCCGFATVRRASASSSSKSKSSSCESKLTSVPIVSGTDLVCVDLSKRKKKHCTAMAECNEGTAPKTIGDRWNPFELRWVPRCMSTRVNPAAYPGCS